MTPLFQRLIRDLMLPIGRRKFSDQHDLLSLGRVAGARCFDVTGIADAADELGARYRAEANAPSSLAFLPAPLVFVEYRRPLDGQRDGFLYEEMTPRGSDTEPRALGIGVQKDRVIGATEIALGRWVNDRRVVSLLNENDVWAYYFGVALLTLINAPGVAERREHPPHAGLQRELRRARDLGPGFQLRPWTEIKIEVGAPIVVDEQSGGLRLGGQKAEHDVRSHPRVIGGKWVLIDGVRRRIGGREIKVKAHKRGDRLLGIVQSRYRVVPPRHEGSVR